MRLLSFALVTIFLCFAGVEGAAQTGKEPPPIKDYLGKTLDQWIDLIKSADRAVSATALQAVLMFPPEKAVKAIPVILAEMKKHDPGTKRYLDASFRSLAPNTLAMIQTSLKKPDEKQIEHIKQTITLLTGMVKDGQIVIRKRAIAALAMFGPNASEAIDNLITVSRTTDFPTCWETRHSAVIALGIIGVDMKNGPPQKVLDALYPRYYDPATPVRLVALEALTNLGAPYRDELKKVFIAKTSDFIQKEKEPPYINLKARCRFYEATDPKDLKSRLRRRDAVAGFASPDKELSLRIQALQGLGEILRKEGKEAAVYLPKMAGYAFNEKEAMPARVESLRFMGGLGKEAQGYLPKVADYAFNEKEEDPFRIASFQFLGAMGEAARPHLPKLIRVVEGKENADITGWAIWTVGVIAPVDPQWIRPLEKIMATKDEPEALKKMAEEAINNILGKNKKDTKKGAAK